MATLQIMAYFLNMINKDHQNQSIYNNTNPRISFSSDFADPHQLENSYREAPVSSDFEFAAPNYTMISADEIFFNGKMLPQNCTKTATTLKDELLLDDDYEDINASSKGIRRWKNLLGLKRKQGNVAYNKKAHEKIVNGTLGRIDEMKISERD